MTTAVAEPVSTGKADPLSDSTESLIDQAFAEPAEAPKTVEPGKEKPQESKKPDNTPPDGKAVAGKEDKPAESDKKSESDKAAEAKPEKQEAKKEPDQAETLKKRLNEQTAVNSRLGRQLKEANEQIKVLQSQIAGTYTPPSEPTADEQAKANEFRGKETASRRMATEKYGETFVNSQIYDDGSPYQQLIEAEPWQHIRVARADHPVEEALRVLRERKVYEELGPDPDQWEKVIAEKLRPEILKELQQQHADTSALVGKEVPGVGEARGAAEGREPVKAEEEFSLSSMGSYFLD